ncbi:M56 family metallopeptidase [Mucilaginibacter galii]|uniref:Peptidase M56 domain-containing protein n=1 Tax=Mucilaginibacter galii TaxID=2005073 RepID=A0A917JBS4_9SPHI|nr:M56 family metallopeptidase [Mucilaginibacter galii]GGI52194.1 hypothetical protein GCM10011425_34060 [Mucilaginibacter galii]
MEILTNLGKISICMAVCYLPYYFVFRKYTFFTLNRWYLLSSLMVSLLIPFIHIKTTHANGFNRKISIEEMRETGAIIENILVPAKHLAINWLQVTQWIYISVTVILAARLLFTVVLILYKALKHGKVVNGQRVIYHLSGHNSSFFNILFLDINGLTEDERQTVLAHEQAHVRLAHSADNLFTAVLKVVFWFNPFIYLMANSLRQNHEFEVDALIASKQNPKTYAGLLYRMSACNKLQILNQFNSGGLKSRVNMLFKSKTHTNRKLQYLVALLFLGIFSSGFILEGKTITDKLPHIGNVLLRKFAKPGPPATSTFRMSKEVYLPIAKRDTAPTPKRSDITKDTTRINAWANDSTYVDVEKGITHLYGDAHVTYGNIQIIAGYIRINKTNGTIFAKHAKIESLKPSFKENALTADSLTFNLKTRRAITFNATEVQ